jgi:sugar phosphate isomerase/epimerase
MDVVRVLWLCLGTLSGSIGVLDNWSHRRKLKIALGATARKPEDVAILHDLGLQFAEIPISNLNKFKKYINKFIEVKEKTHFCYLCHGPREGDPNDVSSLKGDYLPHVLTILDTMPILNMKLLTLHLWMDGRFVKPDVISFKIDLLRMIIDRAEEKGIAVCLENLSEDSCDLAMAFKKLPLLNLTLDVGHAQLLREENTSLGFIRTFPDRIKHIHLHDNFGGNTVNDDLHLPLGEGIVDFARILNAVERIGYVGTATLEVKPHEIRPCLAFLKTLSA